MPDAIFDDPRLAAVYDTVNPSTPDEDFYLALAGSEPIRVLDVGCGTGRLACRFAAAGHHVTGVDPALGMLGVARARPDGEGIRWVHAEGQRFDLPERFDLAVMNGHVFQVFLTDDEVRAVLGNIRRHLDPGGRVGFETRNPAVREWEEWTPRETLEVVPVEGVGAVEVRYEVVDVRGDLVTFLTHHRFPDGEVFASPSTLRFWSRREVADHLADAGFTEVSWYGDFDGSACTPTSPEVIAVARAR
ncbi:MAG TPA: methyltransferase domain-containing protein [Actinomycetota bacterium]